jgi:glycosyltransferase involved in cell wall biosynthesis
MKSILYIGNKLSRHGFTPGVIETFGSLLETEDFKVSYAGTVKNQYLRLVEMLWKTLSIGRRADYIIIDTYSTLAFWYAYITGRLAKLIGTKYITILHGGDLPARLRKSKHACDRLFGKSYANVALSGYIQTVFDSAGYHAIIIPNIIDISKYPFKLRDHCRPRLLWVRSFHRQYNPNMAADVLCELLQIHSDAELCMVGPNKDGSMEEFRKYLQQTGIEKHIKITGKLSKAEWIKLSEDYDFFINTTNVDNTPVSVIEALALGMCVISTDPDGIPYLLNDGIDSFLVKTGDSEGMANQILNLINNEMLAANISGNARKKAQTFDWEQIRHKWIELLK